MKAYLGLMLFISSSAIADSSNQLHWCLDHFPNVHEFESPAAKPTGYGVDFMQELAKRAELELIISQQTPSRRCLQQMRYGETDVMMHLVLEPSTQNYMWMFYYGGRFADTAWQRVNDHRSIPLLSSLNNYRLALLRTYGLHPSIRAIVDALPAQQKLIVETPKQALQMVEKGRVDFALLPTEFAKSALEDTPYLQERVKQRNLPVSKKSTQAVYLGVSKLSKNPEVKKRLEESLNSMIEDDSLAEFFAERLLTPKQLQTHDSL